MKKVLVLLLLCLGLCGCTAEYNLTIKEDFFDEQIFINIPYTEIPKPAIDNYRGRYVPITINSNESKRYINNVSENGNGYVEKYNYKHEFDTFSKSYFINNCYDNVNIKQNGNLFSIITDNHFNCIVGDDGFFVEQVVVNLKTDYKVINNNADEVKDNTYTWIFNESNYQNKSIEVEINTNTAKKTLNNVIDNISNKEMIIILLVLVILFVILYVYMKGKQKKKNKF